MVESKYSFLLTLTIPLVILALFYAYTDRKKYISTIKKNKLFLLFILFFCTILIISYTIAYDKTIALYGITGRYTGTLSMLLLCLTLFIIACNFNYSRTILDWFIIFCLFAAIWGILNFVGFDLFNMHAVIVTGMDGTYISCIGQKTFYSCMLVMCTSITIILYLSESEFKKRIFYILSFFILVLA